MRTSIIGFRQISNRLASLKVRVKGGKAVFFSAYAPHSGKPFLGRQCFFQNFAEEVSKTSSHGPKVLLGDWNARLYRPLPGESDIIGPHVFRYNTCEITADSNRHLLCELCASLSMTISNTFFDCDDEHMITSYNVGHAAMDEVSWQSHSQIDLFLCPLEWKHVICNLNSTRNLTLPSHHFPLIVSMDISVEKEVERTARHNAVPDALNDIATQGRFAALFEASIESSQYSISVAEASLPQHSATAKRPWISERTLALIDRRSAARRVRDRGAEEALNKEVMTSVMRDRSTWLELVLADGDWAQIRKLKKGFTSNQGRLQNASGELVDSDCRAETLAEHLQNVQWAVRPAVAAPVRNASRRYN